MKIHTVRVRNFRCFGHSTSTGWGVIYRPHAGLNLVIGPNGSGKTALLDAVDLALNADGRSNRSLITEYDFPYCDPTRRMYIEVALTDLGESLVLFDSDVQWIDPTDGLPIESTNLVPDDSQHERALTIALEACLDPDDGEIKWRWLLPKFPSTEIEQAKELTRTQHESLGYVRIRPAITAGSFSLGEYSSLGRLLRKLRYRLGKIPEVLKPTAGAPQCDISQRKCDTCPQKADCLPASDDDAFAASPPVTLGERLQQLVGQASATIGSHGWNDMSPSIGPRHAGLGSGLTVGLRGYNDGQTAFLPFERLSTGEKYALAFAVAVARVPGHQSPIILAEEPETALYPTAVSKLIFDLQRHSGGHPPQVIMTTHSESVLRCFTTDSIAVLRKDRQPVSLASIVQTMWPSSAKDTSAYALECMIMPGGPGALFASKVLVVEGAAEAVVAGHLDRLATQVEGDTSQPSTSFASLGWSLSPAYKATNVPERVQLLQEMGKQVAVLVDGDDPGKATAEATKAIAPTFILNSATEKLPTLEDALLLGLTPADQQAVLNHFHTFPGCAACSERLQKCWHKRGCKGTPERPMHKVDLQNACLDRYKDTGRYPPAFTRLLSQIDTAVAGTAIPISVEP